MRARQTPDFCFTAEGEGKVRLYLFEFRLRMGVS
jgi:hypothetical protein